MNYLITGGAGFIGSNLVERLISDGHRVYVVDNLSTGSIENIPRGALFDPGVSIKTFCWGFHIGTDFHVDGIFHLGIPSSSPIYRADRLKMGEAISDFISLIEYAKEHKVRMVYASSSSVYNGVDSLNGWSEDAIIKPTDFYTEVRVAFERIAKVYYDMHNIETIGLRLFSVYGPHEEAKKTFANLVTQMIWAKQKGEIFDIYGDGQQKRDLTYVSDIVDGFILAMNSKIGYDIFNLGIGVAYSMNEVARMIGTQIKYVPVPFKNYVEATLANTSKARKDLGFSAKVSLVEGLARLCPREN